MVGWMEISELGLSSGPREMSAGGRGAARAHFIAVAGDAVVGAARRGAAVRARRRRVPRRGRQGAVAGGNWEAGGHVRLLFWPPGWNMEGGGCGFGGHRPHTEASSAQTCSFFLRGKKKTRVYCGQSSQHQCFSQKKMSTSVCNERQIPLN